MPKIVLVYQPHQNIRQHSPEIQEGYQDCFHQADQVYWLPTFLSREDPNLRILEASELINLSNDKSKIQAADMDSDLIAKLQIHKSHGDVILFMGAGSIDTWARSNLENRTLLTLNYQTNYIACFE